MMRRARTLVSPALGLLMLSLVFLGGGGLVGCGGKGGAAKPTKTASDLPPANPVAVTKMVQGVRVANDPATREHALRLLREAIQMDPTLWEAHYDLGVVLTMSGDLAGAERELKTARKLRPEAGEIVSALAEVERRRGEDKDAADLLGEFIVAHPDALELRAQYVAVLRSSGQVDAAIEQARELLIRKSGDATALAELSLCHLAKGEREIATLLAKQALDSNPKIAAGHRAQGLIALDGGDDAQAFVAFQKAAQADPKDTTARLNMGAVLLRAGVYAKAEEQFRAILQVLPDDLDAMVGLAAALRGEAGPKDVGKLDEVRATLTKVLGRDPHMLSALFNMGVLYNDFLKKPLEGKKYFDRFLDDAPSTHPARLEAERASKAASAQESATVPTTKPSEKK